MPPLNDADLEVPVPTSSALVVAHPGHELRVHAWLADARPTVFVLTDGSGHGDRGRIASTRRVLDDVSARRGSIFGRLTDRDAYRWILDGEIGQLESLTRELAEALDTAAVDRVVSDAVEGFNPVHDLCFLVAEGAVRLLTRRRGRAVEHLHFPLEASPDSGLVSGDGETLELTLDDAALERKMRAAWAYPEMRDEVERAKANHGRSAFGREVLRPAPPGHDLAALVEDPPSYEQHGERRVASGVYDRVLRFREHFLPLAVELRARTGGR